MIQNCDVKLDNLINKSCKPAIVLKQKQILLNYSESEYIEKSLNILGAYNKNLISFKSKVVQNYPKDSATVGINELVDNFEEKPYLFTRIGNGKCSEVYVLKPNSLVIKRSLNYSKAEQVNNAFQQEAKMLIKIPESFNNSQHFETRVRTEKGKYYLVSSYVKGKPVNIYSNPLTKEKMQLMLNSFFELDKSSIYHMDLSNNNILFDDNERANIIDYQWAQEFISFSHDTYANEKRGVLFPKGIIPANIQNYESSGFGSYLYNYSKENGKAPTRELLKNFIETKSKYYEKRYDYFKKLAISEGIYWKKVDKNVDYIDSSNDLNSDDIDSPEDTLTGTYEHNKPVYNALKFERALSKVYKNPNDDVIDIELLRIETLRADKKAYNYIDANLVDPVNVYNSIPYFVNAMLSVKNFQNQLKTYEKKYENDKYMSRYIKYNKEIASFYENNFKRWYPDSFGYLLKLSNDEQYDRKITVKDNSLYIFDNFKSFNSLLSYDKQKKLVNSSSIRYDSQISNNLNVLNSHLTNLSGMESLKNFTYSDEEKNIHNEIMNIKTAYNALDAMLINKRPVDALCTCHYILKITKSLSHAADASTSSYPIFDNVYRSLNQCNNTLESMIRTLDSKIMSTFTNTDAPNIISENDFSLNLIPQYVKQKENNLFFLEKMRKWWDNL